MGSFLYDLALFSSATCSQLVWTNEVLVPVQIVLPRVVFLNCFLLMSILRILLQRSPRLFPDIADSNFVDASSVAKMNLAGALHTH